MSGCRASHNGRMVPVLLTGFEPFGNSVRNPSQAIVERLRATNVPGVALHSAVLPVEFARAALELCQLIDAHPPRLVLALGQAEGRSDITPERIAVNLSDARIPDNAGFQPREQAVVLDGPDGYFSTLPVRDIVHALQGDGIAASISMSAGSYVCNHVFYAMQHHCRALGIQSGFIHVPLMEEQAEEFPGLPTMSIGIMTRAVLRAIAVCLR